MTRFSQPSGAPCPDCGVLMVSNPDTGAVTSCDCGWTIMGALADDGLTTSRTITVPDEEPLEPTPPDPDDPVQRHLRGEA